MSFKEAVELEWRVAVSRTTQPLWVRVTKWSAIVSAVAYFWDDSYFWLWAATVVAVSIGLHVLWRFKTKRWTQPWFGWNNVAAVRRSSTRGLPHAERR